MKTCCDEPVRLIVFPLNIFVFCLLKVTKSSMTKSQGEKKKGGIQWRGSQANLVKLQLRKCQLSAPVDRDKLLAYSQQPLPQASHSWPFKWLLIRSTQPPPASRKERQGERRRGGGGPSYLNNSVCAVSIFIQCLQSFHWAEHAPCW